MSLNLQKIHYDELNARQKENYNFQKISAILADYGFMTLRLSDDWNGADFIAHHIDGVNYHKVQLKGRLTFDKKYLNKEIRVCFPHKGEWYLYDHDKLLAVFLAKYKDAMAKSKSWTLKGSYSWSALSNEVLELLGGYRL